jgi:hypothetical protein
VSTPLTSNDVALQLAKLSRQLDELVQEIGRAEIAAVNAREDFTLAHSKAFLSAKGPMDIRKHQAIEDTHTHRLAAELAEASVRGLRRQIDSVRLRSASMWAGLLGAALRAETSLAGSGVAP